MSGYYDWRTREPSAHEREDGDLATQIHRIFHEHRQVYGSPRVHIECVYNRVRRHSTLSYLSPVAYEQQMR